MVQAKADESDKSLLEYYKSRLGEFEAERSDLLRRISACSTSASESHGLRCAAQKRAEEVRELQQALSAAHMHLFEERDRLLRLQAENDELRMQEAEDRRRIQHLMALANPVDQEVTLEHGSQPSSGFSYTQSRRSGGRGEGAAPTRGKSRMKEEGAGGQRILRTIYLPTAQADTLQLKVDSLQAQLAEQQQLHQERLAALMQDRQLREQDEEAHHQNHRQQLEELTQKVARLEGALRTTTTDFIVARRDKQAAEARAAAADAALADERKAASSKLVETKSALEGKLARLGKQREAEASKAAAAHSKALKTREIEAGQLEQMHGAVKAQLEARVAELETKAGRAREAARAAEARRAREAEGFTADVTRLRQQLSAVDRRLHAMRLSSRLADDERLDGLLRKVSTLGAPAKGERASKSRGTASDDLKSIKAGLLSMENRLQEQILQPMSDNAQRSRRQIES